MVTGDVYSADDAREAVKVFKEKEAELASQEEEKRRRQIAFTQKTARKCLEKEWVPEIRKVAQSGKRQIEVNPPNEDVAWAGREMLLELGFTTSYHLKKFHCSADDGQRPDQPTIIISW